MFKWLKSLFKSNKQSWGGSKVLWETSYVRVTWIWVEAGKATELYSKQDFSVKNWLFLKGSGDYTVGAMKKKIHPGAHPVITAGTKHSIQASNERVEVLEILSGSPVTEGSKQLAAPTQTVVPPPAAQSEST
jgi:mannose-6-phosphate isomerase-like protein (cupin superfamily)